MSGEIDHTKCIFSASYDQDLAVDAGGYLGVSWGLSDGMSGGFYVVSEGCLGEVQGCLGDVKGMSGGSY